MRTGVGYGLAWLLLSLLASGAQAAASFVLPNGATLYNSGINLSGLVDLSYAMTLNPFDDGNPEARKNGAGYLSAQTADSAWITPSGTGTHAPESIYRVDTVIDLTGIDPATITFDGFWVSDNAGLDILVNGASTGQTNTGQHGSLPNAFAGNAFTLTHAHGLVAGLNDVSFEWGNGPAGGAASQNPNPTHVRVEFTGFTVTPVPLPGAAWLLAPAGLWLLRRRRAA